jgi:hypothetical protein
MNLIAPNTGDLIFVSYLIAAETVRQTWLSTEGEDNWRYLSNTCWFNKTVKSYLLNSFLFYLTVSRLFCHSDHFSQTVGLLGRVISSSQGLYLNTGQQKHRINTHMPNVHALCGIRTHDPGFRTSENSACLRQFGYRDRQTVKSQFII